MNILHIIWKKRGLGTFPVVYSALYLLKHAGYSCDIATPGQLEGWGNCICSKIQLSRNFFSNAFVVSRCIDAYDYVIPYEPQDLEILGLISVFKKLRPRIVFHNLEIEKYVLSAAEPCRFFKSVLHRFFFYRVYRRIHTVIIQDPYRYGLFQREYGRLNVPHFFVPNSHIPEIEKKASGLAWFDALNTEGKKIVLYIGTIEPHYLSLDAISSIANDKRYFLIMSGWTNAGYTEKVQSFLKENSITNIFINSRILSTTELNYLVSQVDIGLCLYQSSCDNIRYIAMSSGKYHKFLSFGKPVVVSDGLIGLTEFTLSNMFGVVLKSTGILKDSLDELVEKYEDYVCSIETKYLDLCSFDRPYMEVIRNVFKM